MKISLEGGLPFVEATIRFGKRFVDVDHVLMDTGSAGSVFSADALDPLLMEPQETDIIRQIRGVGGTEFVYSKRVDEVSVGTMTVKGFEIEVGAMHYGFPINGIVGMDFLLATRAIADIAHLDLHSAQS